MAIQSTVTFGNAVPASRPTYNADTIALLIKSAAYFINSYVQGRGTLDYNVMFDPTVATANAASATNVQVGTLPSGGRLYEQGAGAEWKTGTDANGTAAEGTMVIGGAVAQYFFDTTLNTATDIPAGMRDFFSVAVHETLHMLAFNSFADANPDKSTYGQYIVQQNGLFYFNGPNAVAAYGGLVPIDTGNSHAHLGDSATPNNNSAALKGGFIDTLTNDGVRDFFTATELAVLKDVGFTVSSTQNKVAATPGTSAVVIGGASANYLVDTLLGQTWLVDKSTLSYARLVDSAVKTLIFDDRAVQASPGGAFDALNTAYLNILRADPAAASIAQATLAGQVDGGALSATAAINQLVAKAGASTSVATLAYEFFTGKIPGLGGVDYLVSPTGPNPNNLNSPYYTNFNLENRYINFAVNLGKAGDGAASFLSGYGAKSLNDTVKAAYTTIFGSTPTDAKVAALLSGGRDAYFAAYGQDGLTGIGTKAAAVGWLLAEAVKADIGIYAKSNDAFLMDLADGANFAVDIVGVYGKPEFNFVG